MQPHAACCARLWTLQPRGQRKLSSGAVAGGHSAAPLPRQAATRVTPGNEALSIVGSRSFMRCMRSLRSAATTAHAAVVQRRRFRWCPFRLATLASSVPRSPTSTFAMAATMFSQQFAAQRSAAPARARRSVAVRASAEAPEAASASTSKPEATVYFTNKAGARITGSMEQARTAAAHGQRALRSAFPSVARVRRALPALLLWRARRVRAKSKPVERRIGWCTTRRAAAFAALRRVARERVQPSLDPTTPDDAAQHLFVARPRFCAGAC